MSIPIISTDAAQELNQKVQEKIDPRLFLCCNYNPTASYAIGEDGKYVTAIQDLYKFAIDSSCIIKFYWKFLPQGSIPRKMQSNFNRLDAILKHIEMLRSVIDHNNSEMNGYLEKEQAERYGEWLQQVLGKAAPESHSDFAQLNQKLSDMAADMLRSLDYFVDCVARLPERDQMVRDWIDRTLSWYCNNTKQEIYKGQIMDAYIANARENGKDYPELYQVRKLTPKIQTWIKDAICAPINEQLEKVNTSIETNKNILNCATPMAQAMRNKMQATDWAVMESKCQEQIAQNEQKKAALCQEKQRLEDTIGQNPLKFLFNGLEKQLRRTMENCENNGIKYTLLPQDLLQMDVELFFGNIPSWYGDF